MMTSVGVMPAPRSVVLARIRPQTMLLVRNAAFSTVIGAVAGAAIGGNQGAGVGAGTGLLFGTMAGSSAASSGVYGSQRSYDHACVRCMYGRGQRVPVMRGCSIASRRHQPMMTTQTSPTTLVVPAQQFSVLPPSAGIPHSQPPVGIQPTLQASPPPPPAGLPPPPPPQALLYVRLN
jgi:hypothetical protein